MLRADMLLITSHRMAHRRPKILPRIPTQSANHLSDDDFRAADQIADPTSDLNDNEVAGAKGSGGIVATGTAGSVFVAPDESSRGISLTANSASAHAAVGTSLPTQSETILPTPASDSHSEVSGSIWMTGDLGTFSTSAAGTGHGGTTGSGSVTQPGSAGSGGLVIDINWDASVANAPVGFQAGVESVVSYYESHFSNPVTITIDVGYGEVNGQALGGGALGESKSYVTSASYSALRSALVNNANAIGYSAAAASLPTTSPVNGAYWLTTAEAQALGLSGSSGVNGYIGLSSSYSFCYNNSNGVPGSQFDFFGTVAHEISEVMGRSMFDGANFFGGASYEPLDLFHYSASGVRDFSGATPGYFSANGGATNLNSFNTNPGGDYGDWAGSAGNNSFLAFSSPGVVNAVSANDLTEINLLGWMPAGAAAAPAVTIALADDTSGGKNVTRNDAPTGTADGGATVTLTEGSTVLGTTIAGTNGAWSFSSAALPQGLQTVTVSETNGAGVTGSASLSFTFDTIAPNAPAISSDVINGDDSVTLAGTAEANATVTVFDNAIALGTTLCSAGGLWNFTTAPLSEGAQSFTATATDVAGNCSAPSAAVDPVIAAPAPTVTATPDYTHVLVNGSVSDLAAAGVLANDTDSNPADVLTVSAVNGSTANVGQSINGSYGALTMQADGGYSYTNTNADAVAALGGVTEDSFTYTVSDGNGGSAKFRADGVDHQSHANLCDRSERQHDHGRQRQLCA